MQIRPVTPFLLPARAAGAPVTVGLEDAFEAVNRNPEGSPRYPLTWSAKSSQYGVFLHRPVVAPDGTVYQVSSGKIQAYDPRSGEETFSIPGSDPTGPVPLGDRLVCSDRERLFLYDPERREAVWTVPLEAGWGKRPLVTPEGSVLAADGCRVMARDGATGRELWGTSLPSSAGLVGYSPEHRVLVTCTGLYAGDDDALHVLDASGRELWSSGYDGQVALGEKGPLFYVKEKMFKLFGSSHCLKAVDPRTGRKLWSETADGSTQVWSTPTGDVVVREGATLRLRDGQSGQSRWSYSLKSEPRWNGPGASLSFTDRELIVTHPDGSMSGLDPSSGRSLWEEPSRGPSSSGPAMGPEGIMVLKTEGQLKGLLPTRFIEQKGRPGRPGVEETDDAVRLGTVQLRKRSAHQG